MNTLRNILVVVGALTVIGFIALLVVGVKVLGTVFAWFLGIIAIFVVIGIIIYAIGRYNGRRQQ